MSSKEAVQLAREAKRPDVAEKLLDAYQNLLEVMESNRELREEIAELKKAADIAENLVFDVNKGAYFFRQVPPGQQDGPFCGTCWDIDKRLVRTVQGQFGHFCDWCSNRRPRNR
jgi:hypothetical protein